MNQFIIKGLACLFLFSIFSVRCNVCNCYQNAHASGPDTFSTADESISREIYQVPWLADSLRFANPNSLYGYHLGEKHHNYYLVCISQDETLTMIALFNKSNLVRIPMNNYVKLEKYSVLQVVKDTLNILLPDRKMFLSFKITDSFSLRKLAEVRLDKDESLKKVYFMMKIGMESFKMKYPYLMIPYGRTDKKNYIDRTSHIMFDLRNNSIKKVIPFPRCYENCSIYDYHSSVALSGPYFYYVFNQFDSVYRFNYMEDIATASKLIHNCTFEEFDRNKTKNLAYVRNYLIKSESNTNLVLDSAGHVLIAKKLRQDSLRSKPIFQFFFFDQDLKPLLREQVDFNYNPSTVFSYSQGYLFLNDSLTKAYYYAVKEK